MSTRTFTALAAVTALALGGLLAGAAPASAAERSAPEVRPAGTPNCDAGDVCFWVDADYEGPRGRFSGANPDWTQFSQPACSFFRPNWNDCASSVVNRGRNCTVHLYENANYLGQRLSIKRGEKFPDLSDQNFNDMASSNNWC
ncbi:peptidase inhibitor family I36 protein [Crossiella sp. CA198]|uniref:peptidase inhibitor family I36 protein n=1 Tax=Crossiella sp. CA198 TaxID=3455607 RepID=UPI003F8CFCE7